MARRTQQTRDAILQAAALQFARRGYRRTRIGDIIKEVGITPPVFYAHFSTKQQLFIEAFNVFVHWMGDLIEPPLADEPDPAVRLLMRFYAYWGLQRLSPDLLGLARAEALQEDGETRAAVQEAQRWITSGPARDLAGLRRGPDDPPVSDELMAYSLFGAGEEIFMRASWDDAYSPREILRAHLFLYLAVDAAYTGRCDTVERLEELRAADRPAHRAGTAGAAAARPVRLGGLASHLLLRAPLPAGHVPARVPLGVHARLEALRIEHCGRRAALVSERVVVDHAFGDDQREAPGRIHRPVLGENGRAHPGVLGERQEGIEVLEPQFLDARVPTHAGELEQRALEGLLVDLGVEVLHEAAGPRGAGRRGAPPRAGPARRRRTRPRLRPGRLLTTWISLTPPGSKPGASSRSVSVRYSMTKLGVAEVVRVHALHVVVGLERHEVVLGPAPASGRRSCPRPCPTAGTASRPPSTPLTVKCCA